MLNLVSRLVFVLIAIVAAASAAPRAAGLYEDPFISMTPLDTARIVVRASQAELEGDGFRASVLSMAARFRKGPRAGVECAVQFPTIRRSGEIAYGLGDGFVSGSFRIAGDSLEISGLALRGDVRIPMGGRGLAPLCRSSLEGSAGLEARTGTGNVSMRASALYTLAGSRAREEAFVNEHHVTIDATLALAVPRVGSAAATVSWTRYRGGASQETAVVRLERALSAPIVVGAALAVQSADGASELYEWLIGISIVYRFPPRAAPTAASPAAPADTP